MPSATDLSEETLRVLFSLRNAVDDILEDGLVHRASVREVLQRLLPEIARRVGADAAFVETYDEDLELRLFSVTSTGAPVASFPSKDEIFTKTSEDTRERIVITAATALVVAQHLDVAGTWFGRAGLVAPSNSDPALLQASLDTVCEVLDNFLYTIRGMREKHLIMMRLGNALRHRVLGEGVRDAVRILSEVLPMDRLLIVYVAEENTETTLNVQLYEHGELVTDTLASNLSGHETIRELGRDYLLGRSTALLETLDVANAQEEVLINGVTNSVVVGKIVISSQAKTFNTFDRELLSAFAGFVRQRIVDFNKEWRALASSFRATDVARLLQHDDYEQRFLSPREETVAIVYVDIAGFTRLSETVLKTPANVAALVEAWSRSAVDLVWTHGEVFDKMVGDCIIALFGPPFYDDSPSERLHRALECALDIRRMTQELPFRPGFESLRESGLGVATGVHLSPLFVGRFGPDRNFTGFSSGMNNTARLQGCATRNEILVMQSAIDALSPRSPMSFGEPRSMAVKNVAEPLQFRALR